jgi:hypothetical protein
MTVWFESIPNMKMGSDGLIVYLDFQLETINGRVKHRITKCSRCHI